MHNVGSSILLRKASWEARGQGTAWLSEVTDYSVPSYQPITGYCSALYKPPQARGEPNIFKRQKADTPPTVSTKQFPSPEAGTPPSPELRPQVETAESNMQLWILGFTSNFCLANDLELWNQDPSCSREETPCPRVCERLSSGPHLHPVPSTAPAYL